MSGLIRDRLNRLPSANFFAEYGAAVDRVGQRLFAGDAAAHNGTNVAAQPDWLTTKLLALGRSFAFQQVTQAAVLTANNQSASNAFLAGAHTLPFTGLGNAIGLLGVAINDNVTFATGAYGGYFEGYELAGALGPAYGLEVDTINYNAAAVTDPYQQAANQVIGLQLASGGEYPAAGQSESSAAINIRNNGSTYLRGIVFGSDAISGATGLAGTGTAIAFGLGHVMQWFGAAGVGTSSIVCIGTTAAGGLKQEFGDNYARWLNNGAQSAFRINSVANGVNFITVGNAAAGNPAQLLTFGTDANIDLQLVPKGTGAVWLGAYTAGALSPAGYITVKDSAGTVRRLLVG